MNLILSKPIELFRIFCACQLPLEKGSSMRNVLSLRNLAITLAAIALLFLGLRAMSDDPEQVGHQVFGIYVDTMAEANALLEGAPQAAEVADEIAQIKESGIEKLVLLGREIAEMSDRDRAIVEATVSQSLSGMRNDPQTKMIYEDYQSIWQAYNGGDPAVFDNIKSLNILTQYAFFELLRAQEPSEADRLGV